MTPSDRPEYVILWAIVALLAWIVVGFLLFLIL